ncbi:MAG: hypothetical protein LBK13_04505 [Spirochaetales bacterium]|jgi:hypothetical protein|nr:hypothetical protein [Spirochaetales bacterium]
MPLKQQGGPGPFIRSLRPRDFCVIVLWFIGTSVFLFLFWRDLNMSLTRLNDDLPVGIITLKYRTAQRRFEDRVVWDRLQTKSPVYNGDFIRTADLSEATVSFSGDVENPEAGSAAGGNTATGSAAADIDLSGNSLIQIHYADSPSIDLREGNLSVAAGGSSPVNLSASGVHVEIGPGGLISASADADGLDMRVVEGSALFDTASGIQQVAAGEVVSLAADGSVLLEPRVVVLSPRPNARLLVSEDTARPVNFSWRAHNLEDGDSVRIETAADQGFSRILMQDTVRDSGTQMPLSLAPGTYFWRVYPLRGESSSPLSRASTGRLTIIHAPSPRAIAPVEDSVYSFRTRFPAVRFQWTQQEYALYYSFEAADNPELTNPVLRIRAQGTSFVSSDLGAGRWYWRVTPVFPGGFEGTVLPSATVSFVIEQSGVLEAPVLQAPLDGNRVNIARAREDIYFSWHPDNDAASYTILVSSRADLGSPVIRETVNGNFFVYGRRETTLRTGQYYWGVFLTDSGGGSSPVSPARSFTAGEEESAARTIFPPDNYSVAAALVRDIRFTWKSNLPSATRFQVASSEDFSRLLVDEESATTMMRGRVLPEGTYFWRIALAASDGVFYTPAKRLNVVPPFAAPVMENPRPAERVEIAGDAVMGFRWQEVEGAGYYHFRLYAGASPQGRPVYEEAFCRDTGRTLPMSSYPQGAFFWTVQAFAEEGPLNSRRTGLLAAERFAMRRLQPVSLDYPPPGHTYRGLDALRRPGTVRWSSPETVTSRFVLSRNSNPLVGPPLMDIPNPGKNIPLIRLPEGGYYWTIRAETEDGFDISAAGPSYFHVLPVPSLPRTTGLSPADGYRIDAPWLLENRTLVFSWQPVAGANGYIFSLFHEEDGTRRQVFSPASVPGLSYTLKDLRPLLLQGNFIWQVEAVNRAADGSLEQRGIPGENRLRVEVPVPAGPVQTKVPGILYGPAGE